VRLQADRWNPDHLIHRQTYIDLIRAYLADYGSQGNLARALGLSGAYLSYLLDPVTSSGHRREGEHWSAVLADGVELSERLGFAKTPSERRAKQIADELCDGMERRDVLLYHIARAREPVKRHAVPVLMPSDEADATIRSIADVHETALRDTREAVTAESYAAVWRAAEPLTELVDHRTSPVQYAQVLMYLHDTAQVLGRIDIALGFARRALGVTMLAADSNGAADSLVRLRINTMLAEVVSLNSLGLPRQAAAAIVHAESLAGYGHEPETWRRSFLEQKLTAIAGLARTSVYAAEAIADTALMLTAGKPATQSGVARRLMDFYLSRPTGRAMRKADALADWLHQAIASDYLSPLRRAQILRTLIRFNLTTGDVTAAHSLAGECLRVTAKANLVDQREGLIRQLNASGGLRWSGA
jgi:hypothetical protein